MDDNKNLIPDDDSKFEEELYKKELERKRLESEKIKQRKELEKKNKAEYQKRLNQEKVELMKLRQGVIEESEVVKENSEPDISEEVSLSKKKWLENFWYHYKFALIVFVFVAAFVVYAVYSLVTKENPDMTVIVTVDNGLGYRTVDLKNFFEKYCDDLNGDGEVIVEIINIPLNPNNTDTQMQSGYQAKLMAQMQGGNAILFISDPLTEGDFVKSGLYDDMTVKFPSNSNITTKGLSLNNDILRKELDWAEMPDDMYLAMRKPVKTLNSSLEEMQENYDNAYKVFERIVADLNKTP